MSALEDIVRYYELTGDSQRPVPIIPPTEEQKRAKARTLLRRLLTPAQRAEFDRYNSWRVLRHDSQGLPSHYVEFGLAVDGFVVYSPDGRPIEIRNAELSGHDERYCREDMVIAVWLRYRQDPNRFYEECCKTAIHARSDDFRRFATRDAHMHV